MAPIRRSTRCSPTTGSQPATLNRLSTTWKEREPPPSKRVRSTMPLPSSAQCWPEWTNSRRGHRAPSHSLRLHPAIAGRGSRRTGPARPGGRAVPSGSGRSGCRRVRADGFAARRDSSRKSSCRSRICSGGGPNLGARAAAPGRRLHPRRARPGPLLPGRRATLAGDQPAFHQPGRTERAIRGVAGPAYAGLGNLVGSIRLHRLARRYFRLARAEPIRPLFEGQPGPLAAKMERDVTTPFHVAADLSEAVICSPARWTTAPR